MPHSLLSVVFASESLENLEYMFPLYYEHSDMLSMLKHLITYWCVTRREWVNIFHSPLYLARFVGVKLLR